MGLSYRDESNNMHHLTYRAHVEHIRTRCIKRMNVLRCISGFTWGADRKTLLMLYIGLIRSTIEYNCYLFSTISPTLCRRLEAIQSSCLRLITGAFRTSPILALRAETNLPALEHRRLFLFLRYYYRTKCVPNHAAVPAMEARKPQTRHPLRRSCFLPGILEAAHQLLNVPHANVASNPPPTPFWLIESMSIIYLFDFRKASLSPVEAQLLFQEYMAQNIDSAFFYTDGSCHGHQVGSAAVGPGLRFGIRLPDFTTVFSAEVYAIGKVIEHIKMQKIEQATICTDSKSALQALERTDNVTHHGVRNIHKILSDLEENQHVTFLWIPGHYGIAGNERADTLAKEGAMQPHPVAEPMGQGDIIHMIRIKFAEYLQSQWDQHHAPHLYAIKRTLKSWSTCNQQDRIREVTLARLRLGHTRLTHGHLLDRAGPPMCQTCDMRVSVEHILIGCVALRHERRHITNYLANHRLRNDLPTLLGDDPTLTDLVLDFILTSPYAETL